MNNTKTINLAGSQSVCSAMHFAAAFHRNTSKSLQQLQRLRENHVDSDRKHTYHVCAPFHWAPPRYAASVRPERTSRNYI